VYTIIEYIDGFNQKQTLVFDFGKKIEEAQRKIYDRMLAFRFAKERLLESQKMIVGDQKLPKSKITPIEIPKDNVATTISEPTEINNSDNDPLHILRIRFAKGEISKEEYEEMRKMIES
jgi:Short C-terminal domain